MTTQQKKLVDGTKISLYDQEVWDRNTVADGVWLQSETLEPISANDRILASAINYVSEGVDRLTGRIDSLTNASDVIDVYGDWDDFTTNSGKLFDTSAITDNDIIKVLNDKNAYPNPLFPHAEKLTSGHQTYFRWSADDAHAEWPLDPTEGQWEFIGHLEPYYNITEIDDTVNYLSDTIDNAIKDLSAAVSDNYLLSDENGVIAGKNIQIDYDQNNPKITVKTEENVEFDSVSAGNVSATGVTALTAQGNSAKFTNLSAANLNDIAINNFFGSAYSGAAASAYITTHGDDLLNSSHSAYGILAFGDKEFQATGPNYNFKFNAGPGIGFTTGINQVTISAEGTTYSAGNYISTADKTISVTGDLITSAEAGSAASAWINSNKSTIAFTTSFNGTSNVITGYGTSSFAGGISSISVPGTVFTGRNVNFYDSDNIVFTTADNKLTINLDNNIALGETESKQIFMITTEEAIDSNGPLIGINNTNQSQLQLYNNYITRNGKHTTWDKVISASNAIPIVVGSTGTDLNTLYIY